MTSTKVPRSHDADVVTAYSNNCACGAKAHPALTSGHRRVGHRRVLVGPGREMFGLVGVRLLTVEYD